MLCVLLIFIPFLYLELITILIFGGRSFFSIVEGGTCSNSCTLISDIISLANTKSSALDTQVCASMVNSNKLIVKAHDLKWMEAAKSFMAAIIF